MRRSSFASGGGPPLARRLLAALVVAALAALGGCASGGWERARAEDTPAAYLRFLENEPRSPHAEAARERLAYLEAKRRPTEEAVAAFRADYPTSPLADELEELLAARAFEDARAAGSAAAYRSFLARFPNTSLAPRALGNAVYLEASGFAGRPDLLATFVERHPESDYTAEARRMLERAAGAARARAVVLRIDVDPAIADADRLRRVFTERARETYASAGVRLLPDGRAGDAEVLTIRHRERPVPTQLYEGRLEGPGVLAETRVLLERPGAAEPIFAEMFTLRVPDVERRGSRSVLFTARGPAYWSRFFVPVSSPAAETARHAALPLEHPAVAVAVDVGRAITLFGDGSFQEHDLADPARPRRVGSYRRPRDLARFSGVRILDRYAVVYGPDGLEVVSRGRDPQRLVGWSRGQVGAVAGVDRAGDALWVAGSQGLLRVPLGGGAPTSLVTRPLRGVAVSGTTLYVADDRFLYAAPLADPRPERFARVADLGRTLDPHTLRLAGGVAVAAGDGGVVCVEVAGTAPARRIRRLRSADVGRVRDAAVVGGVVYLIGERGLQVFDPDRDRVLDVVDVAGRTSIGGAGRHVVVVGDRLQVVDTTPWSTPAAASLGRR